MEAHKQHESHVLGKCQVPDVQTLADKRPAAASNIGSTVVSSVFSGEGSGFLEQTCFSFFAILTKSANTKQTPRTLYVEMADKFPRLQEFPSSFSQK